MNINIDIEKLILEGMPISRSQARLLQAEVESELARLLANEGLPDNLLSGGVVPGGAIQVKPGTNTTQIGRQIAQEIYRGMKP
ncbi:hypothetical protein LC653_29545 [Nostoc sp. CHAB 5784]|uniref:hypothetical protein n=1 Tax=Nostoc mirabile TaxID=2907820 RepID=UPI001E544512|nr:hypothetical protein [Nostoc mirabile]MCC5667910.1 hypothetical protein [Nostoc mirabile CHAB5784]